MFIYNENSLPLLTPVELDRLPVSGVVPSEPRLKDIFVSLLRLMEYPSLECIHLVLKSKSKTLLLENFQELMEANLSVSTRGGAPYMLVLGAYVNNGEDKEAQLVVITTDSDVLRDLVNDFVCNEFQYSDSEGVEFEYHMEVFGENNAVEYILNSLLYNYNGIEGLFMAHHNQTELEVLGDRPNVLRKFETLNGFEDMWVVV